jgi:hypothetical protein
MAPDSLNFHLHDLEKILEYYVAILDIFSDVLNDELH